MRENTEGYAVVTGASAGIGSEYADRLARRGYDLILVARRADRLSALAGRLESDTGRAVEIVSADLATPAGVQRVEDLLRQDDRITALVNNAGVGSTAPLIGADVRKMSEMVALNVDALMRLTHAAAPAFAARGRGVIINIASIAALAPEILNGVYAGTKAFVVAFTQSLQHELSGANVRVQAVLPGATATTFWETAGTPVSDLPPEIVMPVAEMVDAAMAGFDQGELITIPSLPDLSAWQAYEGARKALLPLLSRTEPAARFQTAQMA